MRLSASVVAMFLGLAACGAGPDDGSAFGSASGASGVGAGESGSVDGSAGETASSDGGGSGGSVGDSEDTTGASEASSGPSDGTGQTSGEGETGETSVGTTGDDSDTDGPGGESTGETPLSDDPFDATSCNGVAWTGAEALAQLAGLPRTSLAGATIQVRTRSCVGEACDAWGLAEDWIISYLTWSGGVVTAYADLEAAMNFVLFDDDGVARLSMQHETFGVGGYPDDDGVLYGFPPEVVNYPHLRAYNQFPESEYDYIDLDYQVAQGELVLGEGCAIWTANPYGTGQPYTAQYGAVFHW